MSYKLWFFVLLCAFATGCQQPKHHYQGYIESDLIYLAEPFSGIVTHRYVHRGQYVKKNQLLFEIDARPEIYTFKQAQATLAQGQQELIDLKKPRRVPEVEAIQAQLKQVDAEIALANLRLKRNQILFDKHVVPADTLDAAVEYLHERQALKAQFEANLALALLGARENQIEAQEQGNQALQASVDSAKWSVEQKKVFSSTDGFIFDTFYQSGEFVSPGAPLASLLTDENVYIEFFVPLRDLHDLTFGKKITYQYFQDSKEFQAIVVYISPRAEYMPPLVYSNDNFDKLVFRIKAKVLGKHNLFTGEPVTIHVEPTHG